MATSTSARFSTPPPPSSLNTPQTPKFGFADSYEPYSPRRKSARVSERAQAITTPPYNSKSSKKASPTDISSSALSPQTAPKKTAQRPSATGARRVSGALNFNNTATAAHALGLPTPTPRKMDKKDRSAALSRNNGMLPTPDKTPVNRPFAPAPVISSVARNLFPVRPDTTIDEVMPTPKKKGRKYTGFTLDSFEAVDAPIQIFTDSHDRVPEVDLGADNPFYAASSFALEQPATRGSKRRKAIMIPGEGEQSIEEAEKREDGMIVVFRGKKTFKKFSDADKQDFLDVGSIGEGSEDEEEELDETVPAHLRRPLTRSSVKPRLLFPSREQLEAKEARQFDTEDEEAITDIDEDVKSTPHAQVDITTRTPKAPKFAPVDMATPPTTVRTTRSKDVRLLGSSAGPASDDEFGGSAGSVSPFMGWQRTKQVPSKKRGGEAMTGRSSKKTRG